MPSAQAKEAHDADMRRQGAAMLAEQLAEHELQRMLEEERVEAVSAIFISSERTTAVELNEKEKSILLGFDVMQGIACPVYLKAGHLIIAGIHLCSC